MEFQLRSHEHCTFLLLLLSILKLNSFPERNEQQIVQNKIRIICFPISARNLLLSESFPMMIHFFAFVFITFFHTTPAIIIILDNISDIRFDNTGSNRFK